MKKIAIVVLHFSCKDLTEKCLQSIQELQAPNFQSQTIIVNNNPKEKLDDLKARFKEFNFLETEKNLGYAAGNNFGLKKALKEKPDFVFILNNDTILDKKVLVELVKASDLDEKIGILAPKIYFAPGYEFHQERYQKKDQGKVIWYAGGVIDWQNIVSSHRGVDEVDFGQYDTPLETDFASGCAILVKRKVFEKIGFFEEKYFLYWEDVDFCQRAKLAGFKIFFVPQAKLWHANAGSSKVGGALQDYYLTRNRLIFGLKYAKLKTKLALIRESLRIFFKGRTWQKKAIRDFYLKKFGQGSFQNLKMIE